MTASLLDQLRSPDDHTRLRAARRAGADGDPELVDVLLDLALHDPAEVQTTGGMAEVWEDVGSAAAGSLRLILARRDGLDERIRRAATDLAEDDERVGRLLYYLGERYEPVRRELATSSEEKLRLRALKAVLSHRRPAELNREAIADPSPLVRVEGLAGTTGLSIAEREPLLTDPDPRVRLAAARSLRYAEDSAAFVAAARVETDRRVRQAFVDGLTGRPLTEPVRRALTGCLTADDGYTERRAAGRLKQADDPAVAAAIASRLLVVTDEGQLAALAEYEHLLRYAPELRDPLDHVRRCTPDGWLRRVLDEVLRAEPTAPSEDDPADGLDAVQQARMLREVLGWRTAPWERAPSPMLTHGADALRVRFYRGAPAVLGLRRSAPAGSGFRPEHAVLHVPCRGCGATVRVEGPVEWRYRDDDRVAESEDGFVGTLTGGCPACGAAARAEVLLSVTESRFDGSREISWDALA